MTKRHFEAFAREIKASNVKIGYKAFAVRTIMRVAMADNPRFDARRFYLACGLPELNG